jgi:MFS family permease
LAFFLLASIVITFLAASSAPTPLYADYQAQWHFSPITTTVVFGIYALAVLASLLVLGKLSDFVGRRRVLLPAIAGQAIAMVVLSQARGVPDLVTGRIVQGLSAGAALGALGAAMLDLDRVRGTFANVFVPGIGTATGALVSGLFVQYLPAPRHLIFLALLTALLIQGVGVALMSETVSPKAGAMASLVPEIRLPRTVRKAVAIAAPVMFAGWALAGFYGSVGPALLRTLTGSTSPVYGGLGLFLLAGSAVVAIVILRNRAAREVMVIGTVMLMAGVVATLLAISFGSTWLFVVSTLVAGIGFGAGFQGGIRTVVPLAAAHERSGVLSFMYVICYLGLGVPAVIAGFLVVHGGGLHRTAMEYGIAVIVLAATALAGLAADTLRQPPEPVIR